MLRKICNILLALILIGALALAAVLGIPWLMGKKLYAVQTASMEPVYMVGDIVIVEPVAPEEIKAQDVITFDMDNFGSKVTHRVLEVDAENQQFITKGDNNSNVDFYPTPFSALIGRVVYSFPYLGNIVSGIRTTGGIIILLWIFLIILLLLFLPDLVDKLKKSKREDASDNNDQSPPGEGPANDMSSQMSSQTGDANKDPPQQNFAASPRKTMQQWPSGQPVPAKVGPAEKGERV